MSLESEFRRSHGSLDKALAEGSIDTEGLKRLPIAHGPADWLLVFAIDASSPHPVALALQVVLRPSRTSAAGQPFHSTGLIARHLHELLRGWGPVGYVDHDEHPQGLTGDLLVSHFWSFAQAHADNRFRVGAAVYVLSDPVRARSELEEAAQRRGVPMPDWDLPPPDFDHAATLEAADVVLLVGDSFTLETFPARWRHKISLVNCSVDPGVWLTTSDRGGWPSSTTLPTGGPVSSSSTR